MSKETIVCVGGENAGLRMTIDSVVDYVMPAIRVKRSVFDPITDADATVAIERREVYRRERFHFPDAPSVDFFVHEAGSAREGLETLLSSYLAFNGDELNLLRQWFDAVDDLNPAYLEAADRTLHDKIKIMLGWGRPADTPSPDTPAPSPPPSDR